MKGRYFLYILAMILTLSACDRNVKFEEYSSVSESGWKTDSAVVLNPVLLDSNYYHDIFVVMRLDGTYPFSNLYIKYEIDGPKGQKISNIKNFKLARKDGKWLGSGMGDLRNFIFPIEKDFVVKDTGTYRVNLYQYMRRENLKGIRDIGIKIVKKDEVI